MLQTDKCPLNLIWNLESSKQYVISNPVSLKTGPKRWNQLNAKYNGVIIPLRNIIVAKLNVPYIAWQGHYPQRCRSITPLNEEDQYNICRIDIIKVDTHKLSHRNSMKSFH